MSNAKSAAWYLFHASILGAVPAIHVANDQMISLRGVITTGYEDMDAALAREPISLYWSPAKIAEQLVEGVPFTFRRPKPDMINVYDNIIQHFNDCRLFFDTEPYIHPDRKNRIIADLHVFEQLATSIYADVQVLMPKKSMEFGFAQRLNAMDLTGLSFGKSNGEAKLIERPSLQEILGPRHYR